MTNNKPDLLRQIATAMEQDPDGWWRGFELHCSGSGKVRNFGMAKHVFMALGDAANEIRRRTVRIDVEVPEPMQAEPEDGVKFWTIDQTEKNGVCSYEWLGVIEDRMVFERGIWPTEAEAQQAADAIFGALGGNHD